MNLKKRDCNIKMKIVPYGGGWTDVYLDFGQEELYFVISYCVGNSFTDFMKILYHFYDNQRDPEREEDMLYSQFDAKWLLETGREHTCTPKDLEDLKIAECYDEVPWIADFSWDEEGSCSDWHIKRILPDKEGITLSIDIVICRSEVKKYHYEVSYKELCYAVAKAYTEMLKTYGFMGYHVSVYNEDAHIRYFLFLKAYALDCLEILALKSSGEKGDGEHSDFEKELELLLFDM